MASEDIQEAQLAGSNLASDELVDHELKFVTRGELLDVLGRAFDQRPEMQEGHLDDCFVLRPGLRNDYLAKPEGLMPDELSRDHFLKPVMILVSLTISASSI